MEKEYSLLFNAITDTIKKLDELKMQLVQIQQQAEEIYISKEE